MVDALDITSFGGELILQINTPGRWTTEMVRLRISDALYKHPSTIAIATPQGELVTDRDHIATDTLTAIVFDPSSDSSYHVER